MNKPNNPGEKSVKTFSFGSFALLVGIAALVTPALTFAANDLNDVGQNFIGLAQTGKLLLLAAFYVGGLFLAGYGLWTCYQAMKPQSQKNFGLGAGSFVVGVFLVILPSLIGLTAETASGDSAAAQQAISDQPTF